ncbi:MAG: L-histidine N(alpha)-methyltransferase [Sandaracinaceae bacterium]|nr:L-histidine N(alpha)-methyltransferase [Sandaracinaceae bacterium]
MSKKDAQVFQLLFTLAEGLGLTHDRDLAQLVGVSPETIQNWRTGAVGELKPTKLAQVQAAFAARLAALRERAGSSTSDLESGMTHLDIAPEANPSELQRQLRDRMHYDYLGHRFLYFEPQGALAWENLIGGGYEQSTWLSGVRQSARKWLATGRASDGSALGPIAASIGVGRRGRTRGLDVISLGPGEGGKEVEILGALEAVEATDPPPWRSLTLVDVSISLLMRAALSARRAVASVPFERAQVMAICADFEEGPLDFARRLPSERHDPDAGRRLVLVLGNVFGNVRNEDTFVRQKLSFLTRPGDLVWLEVGLRSERPDLDPVYRLTQPSETETAAEANRRLLLEGPYRRWEAALGRRPADLELRVWVREDDDSATVPGSYNFCHDLVLTSERRAITMLYSRRYDLAGLRRWLEQRGYEVERVEKVADTRQVDRVAHLLLRRTDHA